MDADSRLSVECLYCVQTPVDQLHAHQSRVCALGSGGGLVVCSGEGVLEYASGTEGAGVHCSCWTPCGNFLIVGDGQGNIRLFHAFLQRSIWSQQVVQVENPDIDQEIFKQMCCVDGPGGSSAVLLVLLASGELLQIGGLCLANLDSQLRTATKEGRDGLQAVSEFTHAVVLLSHSLPEDTRRFCISTAGRQWPSLGVYAYGASDISAYCVRDEVLRLCDVAPLPELDSDTLLVDAKGVATQDSPSKRRRLSGAHAQEGPGNMLCFASWSTDASADACVDYVARGADALLVMAFDRPGAITLYDAGGLFEVHRWHPRRGEDVVAAARVSSPVFSKSALRSRSHEAAVLDDLSAQGKTGLTSQQVPLTMCIILDSGELLVLALPSDQVVFSTRIGLSSGDARVLLSASPLAPAAAPGPATLAFVSVAQPLRDANGEAVLSAVRLVGEEAALDRSCGDLEDLLCADGTADVEQTTSALRRQMELFVERASQGKLRLEAAPVLRLATRLLGHIPGFVINSVIRAPFADLVETREALQGLLSLLQSQPLPVTYDGSKGLMQVTEVLTRLASFEHLHSSFGSAARDSSIGCASASGIPKVAITADRAKDVKKSRRASVAVLDSGGSPSRTTPRAGDGSVAKARRRHSLAGAWEMRVTAAEEELNCSAVSLLSSLCVLEGAEFCSAWQEFRRCPLAQVCSELASAGRLAEALAVFSRHGAGLGAEEVAAFLECLPVDVGADQEVLLPAWIARQAVPLVECPERLVRWLVARAELLETRRKSPDAALRLLGAIISTAMPEHLRGRVLDHTLPRRSRDGSGNGLLEQMSSECHTVQHFAEAKIARSSFWAGSPPPLSLASFWAHGGAPCEKGSMGRAGKDDTVARMFELFRQLMCCAHIQRQHGLDVSLQDFCEEGMIASTVARMLDRVVAPELIVGEVGVHVTPFCKWQGTSLDEALREYVLGLADSLCLPDGGVRLDRASAVVQCITGVGDRAQCLVALLRHWRGIEVPVELQPLVEEADSWPPESRDVLKEQLALIDAQRVLVKYGVRVTCTTHPLHNGRLVHHLLGREAHGVGALQDALEIMNVFPQRFTRAEALFLRLAHIARGVEEIGSPLEALVGHATAVLDCAVSPAERAVATQCFASFCADLLGDWAGVLESRGLNAHSSSGKGMGYSTSEWLQTCSSNLCSLAISVLQRSMLKKLSNGSTSEKQSSWRLTCWVGVDFLRVFTRLRRLQIEFGIFLDPLGIPHSPQITPSDSEVFVPSEIELAVPLFGQHAAKMLRRLMQEWKSNDGDYQQDEQNPTSSHNGCTLTRLLRLGELLGMEKLRIQQVIISQASAEGLLATCQQAMSELMKSNCVDNTANMVRLAQGLLRHFCQHAQNFRKAAELIIQLTRIEETVTSCLTSCSSSDLAPLLELVTDVRFASELLLSSDLVDTLAYDPKLKRQWEELPAMHTQQFGNLLSCKGMAGITKQEASSEPDTNIFRQSFTEIPVLIPGPVAMQAALKYIGAAVGTEEPSEDSQSRSGRRFSDIGASTAPQLSEVLSSLRSGGCVELAIGLLLRFPLELGSSDLRHMCSERTARVLRGGNPVDFKLAVSYLGCMEPRSAFQAFMSALSYLRTEHHRTEHHRLQRLVRLGTDLGVLWSNAGFRTEMLRFECGARWSKYLSGLDVQFDSALLTADHKPDAIGPGAGSGRLAGADLGFQKGAAAYRRSLLPKIAQATGFDFDTVLQCGRDYQVPDEEIVALWVEATLLIPILDSSVAAPQASGLAVSMLDSRYRTIISPVLGRLSAESVEEVLLERVLPRVLPYDYERIGFILRKAEQHPQTAPRLQALRVLERYSRVKAPIDQEVQQLSSWADSLRQHEVAEEDVLAVMSEARRLAAHRLPWHALALEKDPWPTLEPEFASQTSMSKLLPLSSALGLSCDDFYVCFLKAAAIGSGLHGSVGSMGSAGLGSAIVVQVLREIRDTKKAWDVASSLEEQSPLGPAQIAVARFRLALKQREEPDSNAVSDLQQHVAMLDSRWDLSRSGLDIFEKVLLEHGAKSCITSLYYYLPTVLLWSETRASANVGSHSLAADALSDVIDIMNKMGVQGLHDLVDAMCSRHGLSPKQVRNSLIEQWISGPSTASPPGPKMLMEFEVAVAAVADGPTSLQRPTAGAPPIGLQVFSMTPSDLMRLERVSLLAQPRHACRQDASKEMREDMRTRCIFLLRIAFAKESRASYEAKCRAFTVLFRIAPQDEISAAYRHSVQETREIWKLYFYMDAFEKLGMPQDFKRFYQCSKDGLARGLWHSHQSDLRVVQIVAALCLDFRVCDGRFWAAILARLQSLQLHDFLRKVLASLHDRLVLDLPEDPALTSALDELLRAPLEALSTWLQAQVRGPPPGLLNWLPLLPGWLRQSPFIASFDVSSLAGTLLRETQSAALSGQDVVRIAAAVFGEGVIARLSDGVGVPVATRGPSDRVLPPPIDEGLRLEDQCRQLLGALAFEIAVCDLSSHRRDRFAREVVERHSELIVSCVPRCTLAGAASTREVLFDGLLQHQLAREARASLTEAQFRDFASHAVAVRDVRDLLRCAVDLGQLDNAVKLLALFARRHAIPSVSDILDGCGADAAAGSGSDSPGVFGERGGAVAYLDSLCRELSAAPGADEIFQDIAQILREQDL